ncbi:hypothetical protein OIU76_007035 [Salix suchowensis]|nr:hypothetical protein OIU76_007035 [Salix suchowensis]
MLLIILGQQRQRKRCQSKGFCCWNSKLTASAVGRSSRPHHGEPFQLAATASFLGRLYSNDLKLLRRSGVSRSSEFYSGNVAKIVHVPRQAFIAPEC